MLEDLLSERLHEAAADEQSYDVDTDSDVDRGRAALRRRRSLALGGTVVATTAVVASAFGVNQLMPNGDVTRSHDQVPIANESRGLSHVQQTWSPPRTASGPRRDPETFLDPGARGSVDAGWYVWRQGLYHLAQSLLDPQAERLNYDSDGLESSSGPRGTSMGIKLGWSMPGDTGEGLVDVSIAPAGGAKLLGGCNYFGPCEPVTIPGYGEVLLSGDPHGHGGYAVQVTQEDGEIAEVVVDPLFGNNSLTPTSADLVGLDQVLDLAQSPEFNLP